jgi:hypothetical protein
LKITPLVSVSLEKGIMFLLKDSLNIIREIV